VMGKTIQLIDSSTGKVTKEAKLKIEAEEWHFNCNLLVVCQITENEHLLSVWRIENSLNLTHTQDVTIKNYDGLVQVDEMYITVKTCSDVNAGTKTCNFISMKTFQVERSVSFRCNSFSYDKGYLFLQNKDFVRILDVSSGTFLRDINLETDDLDSIICCVNSDFVVLAANIKDGYRSNSKLNVYDLECLKETDAVPSHLLLFSIGLPWTIKRMAMNETRIVYLSEYDISDIDLEPFHHLRWSESF
jgi:hypothetical protein